MRFRTPWVAVAAVMVLAVSSLALIAYRNRATAEEASQSAQVPRRLAEMTNEELSQRVAELRKKLPYQSLAKRLKYESQRRLGHPGLSAEATARLEELEKNYAERDASHGSMRAKSLAALHSDKVLEFMRSEGFGRSRMVRIEPNPSYLELPAPEPVPLARATSADERPGPPITLPKAGIAEYGKQSWSPSLTMLAGFHDQSQFAFVDAWGLGHIKDRDHVAGFLGHGFRYAPQLLHPEQTQPPVEPAAAVGQSEAGQPKFDQWKVARLELVGLLTHETPQAYVSEHLPRMSELADAETRNLNAFESGGLRSLTSGEDLVTEANVNRIHMLGAIRATKQCMECHSVERGTLLGAFSYDLLRDPLLPAAAVPAKPET